MVGSNIAAPATFLLDQGGSVSWSHIGETQVDFADIPTLLRALEALDR
jgi:hypothetical protein